MSDEHAITTIEAPTAELEQRQSMHPLVQMAMASGKLDPATLERLLDLQERYEKTQAKKQFDRAMVALKAELPAVIGKDKHVHFEWKGTITDYRHTTIGHLLETITPHLVRHGFSLTWEPTRSERGGGVSVTCKLAHSGGHTETAMLSAAPDTRGSKSDAQAVASTATTLQRYTAQQLLGIVSGGALEDGDSGEQQSEPGPPPDAIDPDANIRAAGHLRKIGKLDGAEKHVGRKVAFWTEADRAKARAWLQTGQAPPPEPPAPPGDDWGTSGPPPDGPDDERQPGEEG